MCVQNMSTTSQCGDNPTYICVVSLYCRSCAANLTTLFAPKCKQDETSLFGPDVHWRRRDQRPRVSFFQKTLGAVCTLSPLAVLVFEVFPVEPTWVGDKLDEFNKICLTLLAIKASNLSEAAGKSGFSAEVHARITLLRWYNSHTYKTKISNK